MLDEHDPHFALGKEHAAKGLIPYVWKDAEHQRRYDAGYAGPILPGRRTASEQLRTETQPISRIVYEQLQRLQGSFKDPDDDV